MKKTILCLLLALGLLLLSAAAMADDYISYSIDDGNITITDGADEGTLRIQQGSNVVDNINPGMNIYVGGTHPLNLTQLIVNTTVPVKITYAVDLPETSFHSVISIADYSDVTLTLDKDPCSVYSNPSQPGIELGSGSKLTIQSKYSDDKLFIYGGRSAILGPTDSNKPAATVILNSGSVNLETQSGSGISGNVNLVINGGYFKANNTTIDVNSLIITGGELWAGSDSSTNVTYDNLENYENQITCEGGILPNTDNALAVFGNATIPVDLTISGDKSLIIPEGAALTIPDGAILTIDINRSTLNIHGTVTNNGTLNCSVEELTILDQGILNNYGKLSVNAGNLNLNQNGILNNHVELIANCAIRNNHNGLKNDGTISGSGQIKPPTKKLPLGEPSSLTVESIVNGTVTLSVPANANATAEYKANDTSWGENRVFTDGIPTEGRTFYARYKENNFFNASNPASITVYPVSLNANGGTIASGKDVGYYIYDVGATLPTKDDMTRQNYSFAGWYANEALTGDAVTEITKKDNTAKTFWAKWTPDTYNLTLDANGGTIKSGDLNSYTYGEGATLPTDVQKENYKFAGWYANEALTGDPVTAIGASETGAKEYWAKWTADDFTVTLNANGGTINSGDVTGYPYGSGATLPTDVTRTGYTFAGWYDNEALTGNPVTAIGATETGAKEYWAKWVAVLTDPDGEIVSGDAAFAKLPPVTVPTLVLPEGTTLGGSVMLKYVKIDTTRENTAVYDVYLVDQDGNPVKLPAACTLCLPYPEGLNQSSASAYRIHILHEMDGGRSEDFDSVSGGLELTAQGLCVRISSLSPFTITWERFPEINLPQTGDSSHPGLWLALGLLSIAALAALALRGRKNGKA